MLKTSLNTSEIISYFDDKAPDWDACNKARPEKIQKILDLAQIHAGMRVLDVACGTGILFPYYLSREVTQIEGVDISQKMIERAREKFSDPRIKLQTLDIEKATFKNQFERVMVFNALPHFKSPGQVIESLSRFTKIGGRLTIAHDMGREALNTVHYKKARSVSVGLISETELIHILSPYYQVDVSLCDAHLYVISGIKTNNTLPSYSY